MVLYSFTHKCINGTTERAKDDFLVSIFSTIRLYDYIELCTSLAAVHYHQNQSVVGAWVED
jgi:hypothetical protein